jgi:formylglycine-generating enzyme required for sulfatase activity
MIGQGPKRKASSLRPVEHVSSHADNLDDIFVPENPSEVPDQRRRAQAQSDSGQTAAAGPSSVRTRLILRRALLRQARAQRLLSKPAAATDSATVSTQPKQRRPAKPAANWLYWRWRRPTGLQVGIAAAVAGVLCGTSLAYLANDYFNGGAELEPSATNPTAGETKRAALPVPPLEESQAAAPAVKAEPSVDDEPAQSETAETTDASEPLPVPVPAETVSQASPEQGEMDLTTNEPSAKPKAAAPPAALSKPLEPADSSPKNFETALQAPEEKPQVTLSAPQAVAAVDPDAQALPTRTAVLLKSVETFRDCELCPVMVKVLPAQYSMGSPATEGGHQSNEAPQHIVTFTKPFALGQFEITFNDWDACVKDGGCKYEIKDESWGRDNRPAINVSWEDITSQFLPWLSKKTGHKYRLPSEAEWEFAARGLTDADAALKFSFGDNANDVCAFGNGADATAREINGGGSGADCRDGFATTAPAGSFKPNQFGLFDVHGNVWEWVEDCWNETYNRAPNNGAAWTTGDCSSRVVRGGSWNSDVPKLRSAARGWNQPSGRNRSIGFRVARDL